MMSSPLFDNKNSKRVVFLLVTTMLLLNTPSSGKFGGWIGDKLGKGVSKVFGGPGELITGGAWDGMRDRLDQNINHLDQVMAERSKQFTGDLQKTLFASEEKLDSLLAQNVKDLNDGISRNIEELDATLEKAEVGIIGDFERGGEILQLSFKMAGYMGLLIVLAIFIFKAIGTFPRGPITSEWTHKVWKGTRLYLLGFLVFALIVYFVKPISVALTSQEFKRVKTRYESQVLSSLGTPNFEAARFSSSYLVRVDPSNLNYAYGADKLDVVCDMLLYTSERSLNNETLSDKFNRLKGDFNNFQSDDTFQSDPEFFIVSALFKVKFNGDRLGLLNGAIDCIRYLLSVQRGSANGSVWPSKETEIALQGSQETRGLFYCQLEPLAIDILRSYFLNPYDTATLSVLLKKDEFKNVTEQELSFLKSDHWLRTLPIKENPINTPILKLKGEVTDRIVRDQDAFYEFLIEELTSQKKEELIKEWRNLLKVISNPKEGKYKANKWLLLDDVLSYAILKYHRHPILDSMRQALANQEATNSRVAMAASLPKLFPFERSLLHTALNVTEEDHAKATKSGKLLNECTRRYDKVDSLVAAYRQLAWTSDERAQRSALAQCVRLSSELNIYYRRIDLIYNDPVRRPLAFHFVDLAKQIIGTDKAFTDSLKNASQDILLNACEVNL